MKICIIGGGIFGCHVAYKLKNDCHDVTIFDKGDILTKTSINNQHRLHMGFHYPRSIDTIEECKSNYDIFLKEYGDCVEFNNNYYLIHKDSHISGGEIMSNFDNMNLKYDIVNIETLSHKLNNKNNYEYAINTTEGFINLNKLKEKIKISISDINIIKKEITDNDYESLSKDFDIIINLSYENPNLFFDFFDVKYEYCVLVNIRKNDVFSDSITIIDGPFISLYGACNNEMTLSSVIHTPFLKDESYENLSSVVNRLTDEDIILAKNNLISHCKEFLKFSDKDIIENRVYLSYKIKLKNDINDQRPSLIRRKNNVISVLNGKISTVNSTYLKIKSFLV